MTANSESLEGQATVPPELIKAIPLRRPGRWISAAVILIALGLFLYGVFTNNAYDWGTFGKYLFDQRVSQPRPKQQQRPKKQKEFYRPVAGEQSDGTAYCYSI